MDSLAHRELIKAEQERIKELVKREQKDSNPLNKDFYKEVFLKKETPQINKYEKSGKV